MKKNIANDLVKLGVMQDWEFAAFLETKDGPLIEIRTTRSPSSAEPSLNVTNLASSHPLVCHHNHLSHESLSFADWNGLTDIFKETWTHCLDGTKYFGKVLQKRKVKEIIDTKRQSLLMNAQNQLTPLLISKSEPNSAILETFFCKEVVSRAMKQCGLVMYAVDWGTDMSCNLNINGKKYPRNAGLYGTTYDADIDSAASVLARTL